MRYGVQRLMPPKSELQISTCRIAKPPLMLFSLQNRSGSQVILPKSKNSADSFCHRILRRSSLRFVSSDVLRVPGYAAKVQTSKNSADSFCHRSLRLAKISSKFHELIKRKMPRLSAFLPRQIVRLCVRCPKPLSLTSDVANCRSSLRSPSKVADVLLA